MSPERREEGVDESNPIPLPQGSQRFIDRLPPLVVVGGVLIATTVMGIVLGVFAGAGTVAAYTLLRPHPTDIDAELGRFIAEHPADVIKASAFAMGALGFAVGVKGITRWFRDR